MIVPLSRPDASGGYAIVQYSNGTYTHKLRFHFDKVANGDLTLTYVVANGTETTVFDTFTNLVNILREFYDNTWAFSLQAVYQNIGPDPNNAGHYIFVQMFGWAPPAALLGTGGTATTVNNAPLQGNYNMHTSAGGRARIITIGAGGAVYNAPVTYTANTGGNTAQQLVAYLTGANTGLRGHDGAKLVGSAHATFIVNRRLRRRYNQA